MQKYSIIGCLLMATSAIAATFIPNRISTHSAAREPNYDGIMTISTLRYLENNDITCREIEEYDWQLPNCSWTETRYLMEQEIFSSTSGPGDFASASFRNNQQTWTYTTHPDLEDDL